MTSVTAANPSRRFRRTSDSDMQSETVVRGWDDQDEGQTPPEAVVPLSRSADETSVRPTRLRQAAVFGNEIGRVIELTEMAAIRSEGEVVANPEALALLNSLEADGDRINSDLSEKIPAVVALAAAGLVFSADGRLLPSVSGLALLGRLRARRRS